MLSQIYSPLLIAALAGTSLASYITTTTGSATTSSAPSLPCAALYGQCGGLLWTGTVCCQPGSFCSPTGSEYYWQCLADTSSSTSTSISTTNTQSSAATSSTTSLPCAPAWAQCGGLNWSGTTCCQPGNLCSSNTGSEYVWQCLPYTYLSPTPTPTPTSTSISTSTTKSLATTSSATSVSCAIAWAQCGGLNWSGTTCCQPGNACTYATEYVWQCLPYSYLNSTPASTSTTSTPTLTSSTLLTTTAPVPTTVCAGEYNQCGGIGFTGPTCCSAGLDCVIFHNSPYFYTCQAAAAVRPRTVGHSTSKKTTPVTLTSTSTIPSSTSILTITTSAALTTTTPTSTCAASGGTCGSATPCCDSALSCYSEPNLANIPTYTCVIPCAYEYGQCGGITWNGPTCCQPGQGLTCVNEGSPYFYNCQKIASTTPVTATATPA